MPRSLSNVSINNGNTFLILNNEFHNNTFLYGFELFGGVAGSISIQVNKKYNIQFKNRS